MNEPFPRGFQLPRDTPKYDGTTKPEDWLMDYITRVGIAGGNRRVAVRYAPMMMQGAARTWVNSLPSASIHFWLDFEGVFLTNFASTYKRSGRPQQLAGYVQLKGERDLDYLTRWSNLRNTCEGVLEHQAISYFVAGCLDGTMLKQKLLRDNPKSMEQLMLMADKYTTADAAMKTSIRLDSAGILIAGEPEKADQAGPSSQTNRPNGWDGRDRPYHDNRTTGREAEQWWKNATAQYKPSMQLKQTSRPQEARAATNTQGKMTANGATSPSTHSRLC